MNKANLILIVTLGLFIFQGCAGKKTRPEPTLPMQEQFTSADNNLEDAEYLDDEYLDDEYLEESKQPDGLEGVNRAYFSFNDGVISYVFKPINTVYTGFFPPDVRRGFGNFYRNLGYPVRLINALMQFKFDKVYKETASFALNTLFGVGGLFHITHDMPSLQSSPEDFGQTLAFYGMGHGSYVVLPLLGPSSLRDTVGLVADAVVHPLFWVQPDAVQYSLTGHDKTNALSAQLPTYETIKEESFDHYTSMKDIYFQHRTSLEGQ